MNTTETLLCTVCAASFISTFVLLLLSFVQRMTPTTKIRLSQMAFSLTLSAVVVFTLART